MPKAYIDSVPPPIRNPNPGVVLRQFNPLLLKHFSALLTPNQDRGTTSQSIHEAYRQYLLVSYPWRVEGANGAGLQTMSITKNGQLQMIFARPNASWRRMQLATPPVTMLCYSTERNGENPTQEQQPPQMIACPQGLRMGDFYDVAIQGVVCNMAASKCGVVDMAWYTSEDRQGIRLGTVHHAEQYVHNPREYALRFSHSDDDASDDDASESDVSISMREERREEERKPAKDDVWDTIYIIKSSTPYRNADRMFDIRCSTYVEALKRKLLCGKKPPQKYIVNL